ncbi:MAG: pilin [Minisyncoccia bacterium]
MITLKKAIVRHCYFVASFAIIFWATALPVFAQLTNSNTPANTLQNPLRFTSIENFIAGFLRAVVMIALPIITVFIVYAGFKYIMARGNSSKISEAHENFMWVIIGAILILSAWVLATLIGGTVTQLLGGAGGAPTLK